MHRRCNTAHCANIFKMADNRRVSKQVEHLTQTLREAREIMEANEMLLEAGRQLQTRQNNREDSRDKHESQKKSSSPDRLGDIRKQLEVLKDQVKIKEELQLQEEIERLTRQLKGRSRSGVGGCGSQLLEVSKDAMNHGAGNCSCSQLLYEMKLKELEKEVGRLSTNLYETQQTVKEQELKMKMSHERVTERDSQLQRCQDLMVKLECELCEALENVKKLSVERMDLISKVAEKDRLNSTLQSRIIKLTKTNETLWNSLDAVNSDKEETQSECTDRIEAEPIACIRVSSDCIRNHKRAPCSCHSTKQACDSDKEKSVKVEERQTISSLQDEVYALKMQLLDERSVTEVMRQQNQQAIAGHQQLGSDLMKSLDDSEKLRRKYAKAKKEFEEKAALLEEKITEAHCQEINDLREELIERERILSEELKEREALLISMSKEIDSLISVLNHGQTTVNTEALGRGFIPTDVMSKLHWLWKELTSLKKKEEELKRSLEEQKDINIILKTKLKAFNEEVLSGPNHKVLLHQSF